MHWTKVWKCNMKSKNSLYSSAIVFYILIVELIILRVANNQEIFHYILFQCIRVYYILHWQITCINHVVFHSRLLQLDRLFPYRISWWLHILDRMSRWNATLKLFLPRSIIGRQNAATWSSLVILSFIKLYLPDNQLQGLVTVLIYATVIG